MSDGDQQPQQSRPVIQAGFGALGPEPHPGPTPWIRSLPRRVIEWASPNARQPFQLVVGAFAIVIFAGTFLLMLPVSTADPGSPSFLTAFFTSTSATCVTGLIVQDTATYWSPFGQVVILLLIWIGGFGIMTLSSLFALVVSRRLGMRTRIMAHAEQGLSGHGGGKELLRAILRYTLFFELIFTATLTLGFVVTTDMGLGKALWHGVFHSISAFNNAGFALFGDSLIGFVDNWWVSLWIVLAVIIGGLGFPVMLELKTEWRRPFEWSVHTKLTIAVTGILLLLGTVSLLFTEWSNPGTFGPLAPANKFLAAFFQSAMPRTAGFNSVDYGAMNESSWLLTDFLMFIGAGSASTAGGIKVTTAAVLAAVVWSQLRNEPDVNLFGRPGAGRRVGARQLSHEVQREALSITIMGLVVVAVCTILLTSFSDANASEALFESFSAFSTVGLTTGITSGLSAVAQLVLVVVMFVGRVGPLTLGTAFVLGRRRRMYRLPEERPIIG